MPACNFGFIYFLDAPTANLIKIGTAIVPKERTRTIELASPVPVRLIGVIGGGRDRERGLHKQFSKLRSHGEWFRGEPELRDAITRLLLDEAWNKASPTVRAWFRENVVDAPVMDTRWSA